MHTSIAENIVVKISSYLLTAIQGYGPATPSPNKGYESFPKNNLIFQWPYRGLIDYNSASVCPSKDVHLTMVLLQDREHTVMPWSLLSQENRMTKSKRHLNVKG